MANVYMWVALYSFIPLVLAKFPFQNTSLSYEKRTDDLVKRLKNSDIVLQMSKGGGGKHAGPAPAIPRLGISPFQWDTECLRGDVQAGNATSFPQSIGLAASFNPDLIYKVAEATSIEVRAKYNDFRRQGKYGEHTGLTCFSPVINIMRHPLWGRNQETYGEDPYLTGLMAQSFVKGLQGTNTRYTRASAVCKHFDAYAGPEDLPVSRLGFNAVVKERDLRLTFLPQFKECVTAGAEGIMCSYNSVNGVPSCVNKRLLTDILRKEWGFKGFVVSDDGAVQFIILYHRYLTNVTETAIECAKAGLNLELAPDFYRTQIFMHLLEAVEMGSISRQLLVDRVKPLFLTRMKLGEFDPPEMNPYNKLNLSVIQSTEHQQLAVKAATQSFVLLKNSKSFLPIKEQLQTVAIVGPMGDNPTQLMGDYAPDVDPRFMTTPKTNLSKLGEKSYYASGCNDMDCLLYNQYKVKAAVSEADVTFVCLGTGQDLEAETMDRESLSLPSGQIQLLKDVIKYAKGQIVLLIFSAGPVDIKIAQSSPKVMSIMQCFFPAQATGSALFNVITMATPESNPSGRLPYTWYSDMSQVPDMTDYSMTNKTYRYFTGEPLYPFGYGLSYTTFKYTSLSITPEKIKPGGNVTVSFNVTNTGPQSGAEVSQVYISWVNNTVMAQYQLAGVRWSYLFMGQTLPYHINITSSQTAVWVEDSGLVIKPGDIQVYVGGQLPGQKVKVPSNILAGHFTIYS